MKSGMIAADTLHEVLTSEEKLAANQLESGAIRLDAYEANIKESSVWKELHSVRNVRPSFNTPLGMYGGLLYTGMFKSIINLI